MSAKSCRLFYILYYIWVDRQEQNKQQTKQYTNCERQALPPFKHLGFDIAGLSILFHDHSCCSYSGRYSPKWPFRWHICLWVILDHQCGLARHSSPWQSGNHMNAVLLIRRKWQLKQGSSWFYHQPITYIVIYWGGRAIHNLTHGSHNKHEILWHNTGQMSLSVTFYEHMSSNSHLNCIKRRPIQSLLWLRIMLRFWQTFSDIQYRKLIAAYKHWTLLRFKALSRKSVPPKFIWLWMES